MIFYLGGAINGCTDEEANGWRERAANELLLNNHEYRDPMARDYRGREMEPGISKEIVRGDLQDIRESDVLLMNCPRPSWGTAMEIYAGWGLQKRIIVVLPEDVDPSPWLIEHSTYMHRGSVQGTLNVILPTVGLWK